MPLVDVDRSAARELGLHHPPARGADRCGSPATPGTIERVVFDVDRILAEEAGAAVYERSQHAARAHGTGA